MKLVSIFLFVSSLLFAQPGRGGSNFGWYGPAGMPCSNNCYAPYGVIANYDVASSAIDDALSQMYANGQRSIRLIIFYSSDLSTFPTDCTGPEGRGTILLSAGGNLSTQCAANLTNLVTSIHNHGFWYIEPAFFTSTTNDPSSWPTYWSYTYPYEGYYQEDLSFILNVRSIFAASQINYKIDLQNEGVFTLDSSYTNRNTFARRLWSDYTSAVGKSDTVGFSIVCDWYLQGRACPDVLADLSNIYVGNDPVVFSFHFYDNLYTSWVNAWSQLAQQGRTQGWVVGETYYNDSYTASEMASAYGWSLTEGQTLFGVMQWPLQRGTGLNVNPPVDFSAYIAQGF